MLLHNLFWLTNVPAFENIPDYYPGIPFYQTPKARDKIVCSRSLNLDNKNIILSAGKEVILNPGFETSGNGTFEANVVEIASDNMPVHYRKLSIDDYPECD